MWTAVLGGCSDVVVETDIQYDDRFSATELDVYSPPPRDTPRPAVIVIHGGGWRADSDRGYMKMHSERFARSGYVAFNIEYRGTPDVKFPAPVQDSLCALAWVRAHAAEYNVDPSRIASYGYSAGGHLASMLGVAARAEVVQPDCAAGSTDPVAVVISGAGPQDMLLFPEVSATTDFMGSKAEHRETWIDASPTHYVAPDSPPYLFITGTEDLFVDSEHATKMKGMLEAAGVEARLFEVPGGGHLLNTSPSGDTYDLTLSIDTPEAWAATIDFLDRRIGGDL